MNEEKKEYAKTKEEVLFQRFRLGLMQWCQTGEIPSAADQDLSYYLRLQQRRLEKFGLQMKLNLEPEGSISSVHQISTSVPIFDAFTSLSMFHRFLYFQQMQRTRSFVKDGRTIFSKQDYVGFYQVILNPKEEDQGIASKPYACLNCGAISTIQVLRDQGCPYCKTKYLMKDFYPKVANYYCIDQGVQSSSKIKGNIQKIVLVSALLSFSMCLSSFFADPTYPIILIFLSFLLGTGIWFILCYFAYSIFMLIRVVSQGVRSTTMVAKTTGSKQAITKKLQRWSPSFDYEYFEGKVISIARSILLNEHKKDCLYMQGNHIPTRFENVVDLEYRGGIALHSMNKKEDVIHACFDLFLTVSYYEDERIKVKDERIRMWMQHDAKVPIDQTFSILNVHCDYCGSSFDAQKSTQCPYCHTPYKIQKYDWMVTRIE